MDSTSQETETRQRRKESRQTSESGLSVATSLQSRRSDHDVESLVSKVEDKKLKVKKKQVPASFSLISITILTCIVWLFVKYYDTYLPTPLKVSDIRDNPESFIEERAWQNLHDLTEVGVRVTGSFETDVITSRLLLEILQNIAANNSGAYNFEFEEQRPIGNFYMDDDEGHTSTYSKIVNIVAKLEPADYSRRTNHSILVNCHFDTKPGAPGATDNMISCVTMLEMIRVLTSQSSAMPNTILFLFNGAEELGLQGAHGFVKGWDGVSQKLGHRWVHETNIKVFMNLEGAGGGGREILFQTGPGNSWVLRGYSKSAPHPYGTAIAEEAFQQGLIPSDTDFRIFRDFSDIPGLDMAFIKNGWIYHTKWDRLKDIPPGSIQHMGDNALAILYHFGDYDLVDDAEDSDGNMVYFDVIGFFMIAYSEVVGIIINVLVSLATMGLIAWEFLKNGLKPWMPKVKIGLLLPAATIISWGIAIVMAVLAAVFFNICGYPMPFYSYPSLSVILFGIPAVLGQALTFALILRGNVDHAWLGTKMVLAVVLFIGTFITRAVYPITINLLFSVFAWFASRYLLRGWPRSIFLAYIIVGELIPLIHSTYLLVTLMDVFVPILGRSGSETNANLFFGLIISAFASILIFNSLVTFFTSYKKRWLTAALLLSFFLINPLIVFGFVGKIPYQEKTPMRLNLVDLDRTWYAQNMTTIKTDAGYWFWPLDAYTDDFMDTFAKSVREIENVQDIDIDSNNCEDLYCAQPFLWPTSDLIKKSQIIPKQQGLDHLRDTVYMDIQQTSEGNMRRIDFVFTGPPQMTVVLSPTPNYRLSSWSLLNFIPQSGVPWKDRDTYFIYHGQGYNNFNHEFRFSCEFIKNSGDDDINDSVVNVQLVGFFLVGDKMATPEFADFANRFPSWTDTMIWSAVLKQYIV